MKAVERDLVDKPILFVTEGDRTFPYKRGFSLSGLPYYTPPLEKNVKDGYRLDEVLFLPISNREFKTNKDKYFFGFRYLISNNNFTMIDVMKQIQTAVANMDIQYEVSRIRYYPDGEKSIIINKSYDSLFPTQCLRVEVPAIDSHARISRMMDGIVDLYCNWYVDKTV